MIIRKAVPEEWQAVVHFYGSLIDMMNESGYPTAWEKDIYPSADSLRQFIESGSLFVGLEDGGIIAAMVLNSVGNDAYKNVHWSLDIPDSDALVIHILGVSLRYKGRGYGREMLNFAMEFGRKCGKRAIRLDVHVTNLTAIKLYEKSSFRHVDNVKMLYPDIGWHEFLMYELPL